VPRELGVTEIVVLGIGCAGFGLLMTLRSASTGMALRAVIAGLAFLWLAAAIAWSCRVRK